MKTIAELREIYGKPNFTTKQEGYGRKGLFVEFGFRGDDGRFYIQSVYPNIEEHFGITHESDAFYNEEENIYTNGAGTEIDEKDIYTDLDEWLFFRFADFEIEDEEIKEGF